MAEKIWIPSLPYALKETMPPRNPKPTNSITGMLMRKWRGVLALALALEISATALAGGLEGKVVGVTDGDTIKVLDASLVQRNVRLSGIDAPEKRMPFGQRSMESHSDLVFGKQVQVEGDKEDRYGRLVGKVLVNGRDANLAQVKAGMAWHYRGISLTRQNSIWSRSA